MKKIISLVCFFTFFSGIFVNIFILILTFRFRFFAGFIFDFYLNFLEEFFTKDGIKIDYIITNIENLNLFEEALSIFFFGLTLLGSTLLFILFFFRTIFYFSFYFIYFFFFFLIVLGNYLFGFKHFKFFFDDVPSQCLVADMELTLNLIVDLSKSFVIILFILIPLIFYPFFFFFRFFILFIYIYTEKELFVFYNNEYFGNENMIENFKDSVEFYFFETTLNLINFKSLNSYTFFNLNFYNLNTSLFSQLIISFFFFYYISCYIYIFFKYFVKRKKWDSNPR